MEINEQQDAYYEARRQVRKESRFYANILMCCAFWGFVGINDIFDFVNIPGWIVIVFIIITAITILRFMRYYLPQLIFNKDWEERRINELMKQKRGQ
ncbi:2TM domain-containing protein [Elizabethkingia meningoseptica]|uniref:2TM domain-containing protein n=1 Tax=Elizabethkingia meningoseptica TaxID=238 RepID=UPI000332C10A|nr:2TM domain-containing protein [Elizabethkingia meningoseptica]AQX04330.1 hypothetical protein BBD33_03285 [Elizabethkingia meningoseptica]AQX46372.1 hypothetical protein B5G46_03280 [Elizabethkingia meningoseptica]EOR30019.1 hypothetical protein L100_08454 [Elizabethkingia meningoseptica ATCC 13253 = NBRC 12535]KUY18887.1 hypothetical protein ATB99_03690 [Elizabethkingia meningoseptica]MCL1675910.1 2TM domain-containing protein [Elizabethkingia meningoseptica]